MDYYQLDTLRQILNKNHKETLELLNAILCKNSDMWKCVYTIDSFGYCGGSEFMLKMKIDGHTSCGEINEIIEDKIKQEMGWDDDIKQKLGWDNDIHWGCIDKNKTNTEFKFYVDKGKYTYNFTITKTY